MGNSQASRRRKRPGSAAITEPLQPPEAPVFPAPLGTVTGSFPSTADSSPEESKKQSRPNSLEILLKLAFEQVVDPNDIDPKMGLPRQDWQSDASYGFSELPVELEDNLFK